MYTSCEQDRRLEIIEGTIDDLQTVYPSYEREFPAQERKELTYLEALMEDKRYKLMLVRHKGIHQIIGYAMIYVTKNLQGWWLDYIAIDHPYQGLGYGTWFFNRIVNRQQDGGAESDCQPEELSKSKEMSPMQDSRIQGMFLEVEIPDESDPLYENQVRRVEFYERLGAKRVEDKYILPTPEGGMAMYLYYKPIIHMSRLSKTRIQATIEEVYEYIHKDIPNRHQMLHSFIHGIEDVEF